MQNIVVIGAGKCGVRAVVSSLDTQAEQVRWTGGEDLPFLHWQDPFKRNGAVCAARILPPATHNQMPGAHAPATS